MSAAEVWMSRDFVDELVDEAISIVRNSPPELKAKLLKEAFGLDASYYRWLQILISVQAEVFVSEQMKLKAIGRAAMCGQFADDIERACRSPGSGPGPR
jgi:hypothetical protein